MNAASSAAAQHAYPTIRRLRAAYAAQPGSGLADDVRLFAAAWAGGFIFFMAFLV
jgi:hypothetical protein